MRPKKTRKIRCEPGERSFRPDGRNGRAQESVVLTLDELEAIRLADLEGLDQAEVAGKMKVHRSTVSRMLASARKKTADAIVNIKPLRAEGGCCEFVSVKKANPKKKRSSCCE